MSTPEDIDARIRTSQEGGEEASHVGMVEKTGDTEAEAAQEYPTGLKFWIVAASIYVTIFLVALDRTIIGTAVPSITDEFHALGDISWYASAYLVTSCATQLLWGRLFTFYPTKLVFLISVVIFEVGSALCGGAPNSVTFIIGRAIAGVGAAGISGGSTMILVKILPLEKRPLFLGLIGAMFGISSILGPIIGGAFTDKVTWRWCFYINLPTGGAVLIALIFFLHVEGPKTEPATLQRHLIRLDPLGNIVFLPGTLCLLLGLQWGGTKYPWASGHVIGLFVSAAVLIFSFVAIQIWRKEDATVPPRIVRNRSVAGAAIYAWLSLGSMVTMIYILPVWFQGIKHKSAMDSGINMFPITIAMILTVVPASALVQRVGYYVPPMIVGAVVMAVGTGLITTFNVHTTLGATIGYQTVYGIGLGAGMQQPIIAVQAVLKDEENAMGMAIIFFMQSLGGAIFQGLAQALFVNYLSSHVEKLPGLNSNDVIHGGATQLDQYVPAAMLEQVLVIYNAALRQAFYVALALSCLMVLPCLGMEWINIKKKPAEPAETSEEKGQEQEPGQNSAEAKL